jgi:hypothetical protein
MSSKMSLPSVKIVRSPATARGFKRRSRGRGVSCKKVSSPELPRDKEEAKKDLRCLLVFGCRFDTPPPLVGEREASKRTPSAPRDCKSRWQAGAREC